MRLHIANKPLESNFINAAVCPVINKRKSFNIISAFIYLVILKEK